MRTNELIEKIKDLQSTASVGLPIYGRPFCGENTLQGNRAILVVGARGTGKTTWLLKEAQKHDYLYVFCDHPMLAGIELWRIAEDAFSSGYRGIVFDEIHHAENWSQQLKSIYDTHPRRKILASDSSSLVLRQGLGDLSRRFVRIHLPLLSLREYIYLKDQVLLERLDPFMATEAQVEELASSINILKYFQSYLNEGFRPVFLEGSYSEKIVNILEKQIFYDIPLFVPQIHPNHLRLMNVVVKFLSESSIPTLNIDSLCRDWTLSKEKIYQLLNMMEFVEIINIIRKETDHKVSGKGAKIFLTDPSFYVALRGNIGNLRESFVATMGKSAGLSVFAAKDERDCDFVIDGRKIEVGGKEKARKNADFVVRDDLEMKRKNILPLWTFGMMH